MEQGIERPEPRLATRDETGLTKSPSLRTIYRELFRTIFWEAGMRNSKDGWDFSEFFAGFGPRGWGGQWGRGRPRGRRNQMFESGEVKFVILRLLKEKPRHGYEIIKALEEKMGGCYTPSAGTVYPTSSCSRTRGTSAR
jgi:hypothetical protein